MAWLWCSVAPCAASGSRSSGVNCLSFDGGVFGVGASDRPGVKPQSGPPISLIATTPASTMRSAHEAPGRPPLQLPATARHSLASNAYV